MFTKMAYSYGESQMNLELKLYGYVMAAGVGAILEMISSIPAVINALLALMTIDILSGLGAAYIMRNISAQTCLFGMVRKTLVLMLVLASYILTYMVVVTSGADDYRLHVPAGGMVAGMFCMYEFISIIENCAQAGIYIPPILQRVLKINNEPLPFTKEQQNVGR